MRKEEEEKNGLRVLPPREKEAKWLLGTRTEYACCGRVMEITDTK